MLTSAKREGDRGDWKGLFLLGAAASTDPTTSQPFGLPAGVGDYGGGPSGTDGGSCGTLRYVRVEFAGGPTSEDARPGAWLTLAGCGEFTTVDFVQVHRATDGVRRYGGAVRLPPRADHRRAGRRARVDRRLLRQRPVYGSGQ